MSWFLRYAISKADLFRQHGAEVRGGKVVLYRGGNVPEDVLRDLRYGDFLSAVESGTDATGNLGADSYGDVVIRVELPLEHVELASTGEFQYKGPSTSLSGGRKWPPEVYRAYNDYWASNLTAEEIDRQTDVRPVASMALPGGREEFDRLVEKWR